MVIVTGAHTRGRDKTRQDKTRQTWTGYTREVTSRPDEIKLNRQDYKYTGKS